MPGDIIVERGYLALSMHFIVRGKLRVERCIGNKSVYLDAGSWIGDKCLFIETSRTHTVSSVTPSEVLCVQKRNIMGICNEFPAVQLSYLEFQRKICNGENIAVCPVCNQIGHSEEDCPNRRAEREAAAARRPSLMVPTTITRRLSLSHAGAIQLPKAAGAV